MDDGRRQFELSATPLAFALWQLLSCQTRPMKGRPVRDQGLGGQRTRSVGVCAAAVNCAQLAR